MNVFTLNFDLIAHLERQRDFSERTFGPGARTQGVCDHIRKELREIEAKPADVSEWIDVALLALDGAWRAGYTPTEICEALAAKQRKNEARKWPDWRTADPNKAIEHDRSALETKVTRRWVDHGSLNNGRCPYALEWNGPCCRLPEGHDGEHKTDGQP